MKTQGDKRRSNTKYRVSETAPAAEEKKRRRKQRAKRALVAVAVVAMALTLVCGAAVAGFFLWADKAEFDAELLPTAKALPVYLDAYGNRIETADTRYVTADEIPDKVAAAFVALEDRRFYKHKGYDVRAIGRALVTNLKNRAVVEGGSTITQQLVKNTHLDAGRTLERKVNEIAIARKIEKAYSKDEILAMYLNVIYFGGGAYGIADASRLYFGCAPQELTTAQAATLAGILKNPSRYSPANSIENATNRRNLVLDLMCEEGYITPEERDASKAEKLRLKKEDEMENYADFYIECAAEEVCKSLGITRYALDNSGITVYTCLDPEVQSAVGKNALNRSFYKEKGTEGSVAVIDNLSGGIAAYFSTAGYEISRQGGSVLKPLFVYGPAYDTGTVTPFTPVVDEPCDYGGYTPQNFGGKYYGPTTPYDAVAKSMNAAAVKVMSYTGADKCAAYGRNLGFELSANDENYSLALGATEKGINPKLLAGAYSAVARGGEYVTPYFVRYAVQGDRKIYTAAPERRRVFGDDITSLITDSLVNTVKNGTAKSLSALPFAVAAKTGTVQKSEEYNTDAWCAGYTSAHTFAVWHGGSAITELGGGHATLQAAAILREMYSSSAPQDFAVSDGVEVRDVDVYSTFVGGTLTYATPFTPSEYVEKRLVSKRFSSADGKSRFADNSPRFDITTANGKVRLNVLTEAALEYEVFCRDLLGERKIAQFSGGASDEESRLTYGGKDISTGEYTVEHTPFTFGGEAVYTVRARIKGGDIEVGSAEKSCYPPSTAPVSPYLFRR